MVVRYVRTCKKKLRELMYDHILKGNLARGF